MGHPLPDPLIPLAAAWQGAVRTPRRRAVIAGGALVVAVALLVARAGTPRARIGGAAGMIACAALVAFAARRERLVWTSPHRTIARVAGRVDPERAARAQRALGLLDEERPRYRPGTPSHDGTSPELAELHVRRALAALPAAEIEQGAHRVALRFATGALTLAVAVLAVAVFAPWSVIEGLDVLIARHHIAPIPMTWLGDPELHSRPPDYLHDSERQGPPFGEIELPRGTLLTYVGVAIHPGRNLALTDGTNDVPFVDDGKGALVARWPLDQSVSLRVIAIFGDVRIEEGDSTHVTSVADEKPVVTLEGAPKTIELAHDADVAEIPIRYEATDDHGLREVHLVLRAGGHEERRVLAHLDGETRDDKGGHVLHPTDKFIKKSHVPVEVTVEAKDNDPITGPKWGASAAITIVPPAIAQPQSLRLESVRQLRDRFVDSLAWRMEHPIPKALGERKTMLADEGKTVDDDADLLDETVSEIFAGVRVPGRLQALLRGQMRKVREAMTQEARVASPQTHGALVKASEKIVLVTDAIVRGLGERDARSSARQLADVADDVVTGEGLEARADDHEKGKGRVDAGLGVLEAGSKSMRTLGDLGRDLGEIVQAYDARIARARTTSDWSHAELAARDLVARLREPDPSFGERGGPQKGGGESGGGRGTPGEGDEEGDDVARAFDEAARDLEQLAQDHAGEIAKVQNDLSGEESAGDEKSLLDESKKHAENVRQSVRDLPSVGGASESWSGKAAAAREQAEQMARALEEGSPGDAVASGRNALQTLDEAKRASERESWRRWTDQATPIEKQIDDVRRKLEPEVAWAEQELQVLRKKAAERARGELGEDATKENEMAERTRRLGEKGRDQMPGSALDALEEAEHSMQKAADQLRAGEPDRAISDQQDAQRQLEMARQAMGSDKDEGGEQGDSQTGDDNSGLSREKTDIPNADAHKGPEDFRRRVTQGLSQPASGRLKDAIRRYAEGLLR
ncbi:MAG: DUF4175 domain-containing protein [Polyangiaceae bacterium]